MPCRPEPSFRSHRDCMVTFQTIEVVAVKRTSISVDNIMEGTPQANVLTHLETRVALGSDQIDLVLGASLPIPLLVPSMTHREIRAPTKIRNQSR